MPDDRPPDYDQLRISVPIRRSFQAVDSVNNDTHDNRRTISSLNVNNLDGISSQKANDEEVEPPPYESLFPEEDNPCSSSEHLNRREENRP